MSDKKKDTKEYVSYAFLQATLTVPGIDFTSQTLSKDKIRDIVMYLDHENEPGILTVMSKGKRIGVPLVNLKNWIYQD